MVSLFTLVNFANVECQVNGDSGLCVLQNECDENYGRKIGSCAKGFGVCCFKSLTCGGSTSMNITYIRNKEYPSYRTEAGVCQYTIEKKDAVCQLRLDFQDFEISQPENSNTAAINNGHCQNDIFTVVSGTSTKTFEYLCGSMPSEWHYYLDVKDITTPTVLQFSLSGAIPMARRWSIKVSYIPCDQYIPQGCGQYFTGNSGSIYSFNYGKDMYLNGMNYGICFRKERDRCGYTITDKGPSWIGCTDLLRIPTNFYIADSYLFPYCLLPVPLSVQSYPTSIEQRYNGPLIMGHNTNGNGLIRHFGTTLNKNNGFYMDWETKTC